MDLFLIIASSIVGVLLIGVNFYLLALYCHPDDKGFGASLFCKILVILGLTLSWAQVLLMPLDVSINKDLTSSDVSMKTLWYVVYMFVLVMVVVLLPFAQFYYETDDEKTIGKRFLDAMLYEFCALLIVGILLVCGFTFLNVAQIPIHTAAKDFSTADGETDEMHLDVGQSNDTTVLSMPVSFPIFCMAFMAFIGWFLFVLFGGVGLSALPLDMINEFIGRPKLISSKDAAFKKTSLKKQTVDLLEKGSKIKDDEKEAELQNGFWAKRKSKNKTKTEYQKFKTEVLILENEYEIFKLELEYMNTNPIVYWLKLVVGIIFVLVSICWWLQILLYMTLKNSNGYPLYSFLNVIFLYFETSIVGFIGSILLAFFCIYLLWAAQKGNLKFGMRIPFLFTIHPMKVNETWMNSFLFNVNLILICSVSVTQFSCQAFSQYTRNSEIALMFQSQIQYLPFFTWFFANQVFEIALLAWSGLVAIYLIVKPADKPRVFITIFLFLKGQQLIDEKVSQKQEIELQKK